MADIGMMYVETDNSKDVLKATNEELGFTTKYFTLKQLDNADTLLFATTVIIPATYPSCTYATFTHNLGSKPAYEMYFENHDGRMFRIPGRSDDVPSPGYDTPSCGFVYEVTITYIKIQVGYYGGGMGHAHDHTRQILCKIYVESEIQ